MGKMKYVASFIARQSDKALFVGLYSMNGSKTISREEFHQLPSTIELFNRGMTESEGETKRMTRKWFDLSLMEDFYPSWKGKLIIDWPPPGRSWWRRAHKNIMPMHAILQDSALVSAMKPWNEIVLTNHELNSMPTRWQDALQQWKGIYYIFDSSDGKAYVGSAYGADNLLGRWKVYAVNGHGGNKLLKGRDPKSFVYSILQIVSHDTDPAEVIRLESTWKIRLHTREPDGLNDN